jgi:HK97 family phage major capsid protein
MRLLSKPNILAVRAQGDVAALIGETRAAIEDFKKRHAGRVDQVEAAVDDLAGRIANMQLNGVGGPAGGASRATLEALGTFAKIGEVSAAMSVGSLPDGGVTVVEELDRQIVNLQRDLSPIRRLAAVTPTRSAEYVRLVNLGGTASGWVSETDPRPQTDTSKLTSVPIKAFEVYANPAVTQQLLDDSEVDVANFVLDEIATEFAEREGDAFLNGDGTTQPKGVLTYPSTDEVDGVRAYGTWQHVLSGSASEITPDSLTDLFYSAKVQYRRNGTWLMNSDTARLVSLFKDKQDRPLWRQSLAEGEPSTLLGRPVEIDENMPAVAADAVPIIFGDWRRGYQITDRLGMRLLRDPYTAKPWVLFYATKRVGGAAIDTRALKLLRVGTESSG